MGKKIKILDLFPDVYMKEFEEDFADRKSLSKHLEEKTNGLIKLETVFLDKGNSSIECGYDEALAAPYVLQKVKWAQENGYDAVVIDCFIDVALDAARELACIPILGACQSSCSLAARLGGRFSIISILPDMDRPIRANIAKYGLNNNLVSIPVINVPVLGLQKNFDSLIKKVVKIAEKAVLKDGARALVFGCTGMSPIVNTVQKNLKDKGVDIPIIEPLRAAVFDAIAWVMMGVSHSKEAYKHIRSKYRILDWEI